MKRAAMPTFVFVLATILVPPATLFNTAGAACPNITSMKPEEACLKSCNTNPQLYKLCLETLQPEADNADEVTSYALLATRQANLKYNDTMNMINPMLGAGNLPNEERQAVSNCKEKYGEAGALMASVTEQLVRCDFTRGKQEYLDAEVAIRSCQDGLSSFQFLPLYATVSADHDATVVAYLLGGIIFGS
jgi:pectinesterase inhibitor-like protein